jgi:CheY-like chemotaxis protein
MKKITSKFPGLKILVVEDNFINQEVCKDILEFMGCVVDVAKDGLEAVEKAKNIFYDAILMDIHLPSMDGYEATRQIRLEPSSSKSIIIALTASALDGDRQKCLDAGMNDYISKPMEAYYLEDTLLKYFSHKLKN